MQTLRRLGLVNVLGSWEHHQWVAEVWALCRGRQVQRLAPSPWFFHPGFFNLAHSPGSIAPAPSPSWAHSAAHLLVDGGGPGGWSRAICCSHAPLRPGFFRLSLYIPLLLHATWDAAQPWRAGEAHPSPKAGQILVLMSDSPSLARLTGLKTQPAAPGGLAASSTWAPGEIYLPPKASVDATIQFKPAKVRP